jgi:hypothetical protein
MLRREFLAASAAMPLRRKAGRCIFLKLTGGPSQLDTWDPKPDAPREIRGPFRAIPTSVPGIQVTELFPKLARQAHRVAFVRSMYSDEAATHESIPPGMASFGQRCVTVNMFDTVIDAPSWDTHGSAPFTTMNCLRDAVAPRFDQMFTRLLQDLDERGLLESTMVVAAGEFGRTPRTNASGGRDHWTGCWTALFAGGPVRGGQVIGSSDSTASEPRDRPVSPAEFQATIAFALGVTPHDPTVEPAYKLFR